MYLVVLLILKKCYILFIGLEIKAQSGLSLLRLGGPFNNMPEKSSGGPSELLLIVAIPACLGFKAFPGPVRLPPRMQPIGRSHLMARLAMSLCAS